MTALATTARIDIAALADLAVLSLASPHSRRAYSSAIRTFLGSGESLTRDGVQRHVLRLREAKGAALVNQAVAAIRLLAREAYARGMLSDSDLYSIETIKGSPVRGIRMGNWLEVGALRHLMQAAAKGPDGIRNAAIVACMAGCGMRRSEVAGVTWDQWQRRGDRWMFVDLIGKRKRVRSIPVPDWVARRVNEWKEQETHG